MTAPVATAIEHAIGTAGIFSLRIRRGSIRIQGVDGDAVRLGTAHGDDLDDLVVERGPGSLEVRAGHRTSATDLDVQVPTGAMLVVDVGSADLVATATRGDQRYRSVSGEVDLRDVEGSITVDSVSGDVDIATRGWLQVQARTVSGDLAIRAGIIKLLHAATTSGDLRIAGRFDDQGSFRVETVSGDTTLAAIGGASVEVTTITGDIRGEVAASTRAGRGRRSVVVGSGGARIAFRSTSGDLRIVPAEAMDSWRPTAGDRTPDATAQLDVLTALERGEIDVTEAGRRLERLDRSEPSDDAAPVEEP